MNGEAGYGAQGLIRSILCLTWALDPCQETIICVDGAVNRVLETLGNAVPTAIPTSHMQNA